jgi:N-acetylmuramoyl-L-alanine amidase
LVAVLLAAGCGLVTDVSFAPETAPLPRRTATETQGVPASPSPSPSTPELAVDRDRIPYSAQRKREMADYARRHYGIRGARLEPNLIVLHFSETEDYASVRSHFASNEPNMGERPGVCAHYVIEQDGTVHELVPPDLMCRHTVGLNHRAIGIEFVQSSRGHRAPWAVRQILARRPQMSAGLALVRQLQERHDIGTEGVIGHAMANTAAGFRDLLGWHNDHVDWQEAEVRVFRRRLLPQ